MDLLSILEAYDPSKIAARETQSEYYRQLIDDHRKSARLRAMEVGEKRKALKEEADYLSGQGRLAEEMLRLRLGSTVPMAQPQIGQLTAMPAQRATTLEDVLSGNFSPISDPNDPRINSSGTDMDAVGKIAGTPFSEGSLTDDIMADIKAPLNPQKFQFEIDKIPDIQQKRSIQRIYNNSSDLEKKKYEVISQMPLGKARDKMMTELLGTIEGRVQQNLKMQNDFLSKGIDRAASMKNYKMLGDMMTQFQNLNGLNWNISVHEDETGLDITGEHTGSEIKAIINSDPTATPSAKAYANFLGDTEIYNAKVTHKDGKIGAIEATPVNQEDKLPFEEKEKIKADEKIRVEREKINLKQKDEHVNEKAVEVAAKLAVNAGILPSGGMGDKVQKFREAVYSKAQELRPGEDIAKVILNAKRNNLAADTEIRAQARTLSQIEGYARQALKNIDSVEELLPKVGVKNLSDKQKIANALGDDATIDRLGIKKLDELGVWFRKDVIGNAKEARYYSMLYETAVEYAKVVSGSLGAAAVTDSARRELQTLVSVADNPATVRSVFKGWKRQIKNSREGHAETLEKAISGTLSKETENGDDDSNPFDEILK